jgi:cysteine-rich repeat protein
VVVRKRKSTRPYIRRIRPYRVDLSRLASRIPATTATLRHGSCSAHSPGRDTCSTWLMPLVLLLALLSSVATGQELLTNRDFQAAGTSSPPLDLPRCTGTYVRVDLSSEAMPTFPGNVATAIKASPSITATQVALTSPLAARAVGWYRARWFLHVAAAYDGRERSLITVDVVDGSGTTVPGGSTSITLRSARGQWLHYDHWVPSNTDRQTRARITLVPGASWGAGTLLLTDVSITFSAGRGGQGLGLARVDLTGGETEPSLRRAALQQLVGSCPAPTPTSDECPPAYGSVGSHITHAIDHDLTTNYWISPSKQVSAIELDLGTAGMLVCGIELRFPDAGTGSADSYPRVWRVRTMEKSDGYLAPGWVTQASAGAGGWMPVGNGLRSFGMRCATLRRVRLEMESASFLIELYELTLLSRTPRPCEVDASGGGGGCLHGGVCGAGGCTCPHSLDCTHAECGWAGPACELAACVQALTCANSGTCGGPNTCTCRPGYYGTAGATQCTATVCGDGVHVGAEECDDGNSVLGDGCGAGCTLEPPPPGTAQELGTATAGMLPRQSVSINGNLLPVTAATVAAALGVNEEQIRFYQNMGNGWVNYRISRYKLTCVRECKNNGLCVIRQYVPSCACINAFSGLQCEISPCSRACDHGGICTGVDQCSNCCAGWSGAFCGTISHSTARWVLVIAAGLVFGMLSLSTLVVLCRWRWIPIKSRGPTSLLFSLWGGQVWLVAATVQIWAEPFGYDAADPSLWQMWLLLVAGFGVWFASNITYLRAMCQIHIFHAVPLNFFVKLVVALAPWVLVAVPPPRH